MTWHFFFINHTKEFSIPPLFHSSNQTLWGKTKIVSILLPFYLPTFPLPQLHGAFNFKNTIFLLLFILLQCFQIINYSVVTFLLYLLYQLFYCIIFYFICSINCPAVVSFIILYYKKSLCCCIFLCVRSNNYSTVATSTTPNLLYNFHTVYILGMLGLHTSWPTV